MALEVRELSYETSETHLLDLQSLAPIADLEQQQLDRFKNVKEYLDNPPRFLFVREIALQHHCQAKEIPTPQELQDYAKTQQRLAELRAELDLMAGKKRIEDLNTAHDLAYNEDRLDQGGGKLMVYIGEKPHMLNINGRKALKNEEGDIEGMQWYVSGHPEFGIPNDFDGWQKPESVVVGRKDPILNEYYATQGEEVFLLQWQQVQQNSAAAEFEIAAD